MRPLVFALSFGLSTCLRTAGGTRHRHRSKLRLALGSGLCFGDQPALPPASEADRQELPRRRDVHKVTGEDRYLYRAVDSTGQTVGFLLIGKRDAAAAKRFFGKAVKDPSNLMPRVIHVDKESGLSASGGGVEGGWHAAAAGASASVEVSEQHSRTGSSGGEKADVAGEGVWLDSHGLADAAKDRTGRDDSERASTVGAKGDTLGQAASVDQLFGLRRLNPPSSKAPGLTNYHARISQRNLRTSSIAGVGALVIVSSAATLKGLSNRRR